MQYTTLATLAFALGASARPQFSGWCPPSPPPPPGSAPPLPFSSGEPEPSAFPVASGAPSGFPSGFPSGGFSSLVSAGSSLPIPSSPPIYPIGNSSVPSVSSGTGVSSAPSVPSGSGVVSIPQISIGSSVDAPSGVASSFAAPSAPASSAGPGSSAGAASSAAAVTSTPASSGSLSSGGGLPASSGTSVLSAAQTIAAGDSFDCGMVMYDRGVSCTGQEEGGDSDAVFILEQGASLSNCIIGPNQIEGVHCFGGCSLTNIWWSAVCEDAFTVKEQDAGETTTINGGGAFGADDKVLQHNGGGTISVSGFTVDTFGKVYRSCGNCDEMFERHVIMDDISASGGSEIAGINSNYGDTATLTNIKVSDVDDICVTYTGNDTGDEPEENGSGPSEFCIYDDSDITEL